MQIQVEIPKLDAFIKAMQEGPVIALEEGNKSIQRIVLRLEATAKREAPVNKQPGGGNLRQSIRGRMTGPLEGVVEVGASYAVFVHQGTRPHIIVPVRAKALANVRTGQFFGKRVNHPGTKANPFLQRALDAERPFIDSELNIAGQIAMERIARII